ncbi:hypothetical protein ACLESO_25835 [Pyxidicoccus sp. 3LG]
MMRFTLMAFLLAAVPLSSARAGEPDSWTSSFSTTTLAPHLGDAPARYLVVPAGSDAPELTEAREALAGALRASGKARLVMDARALGPVAQLDDASIAKKSAVLPVDRVMVLRLFPDATGALTQAVVTVYDTSAQPLGSFATTKGVTAFAALTPEKPQAREPVAEESVTQKPTPQEPVTEAPVAVAPQAQEPVAEAPSAPLQAPVRPVPPADAWEQYEQRAIGFDDYVAVRVGGVPWATWSGNPHVRRWAVPYEGKYKKPLEGDAFYQKMGRADLVEAYAGRMRMKTVLGVIGGAAAVGGGIVIWKGLTADREDCDINSPGFSACVRDNIDQGNNGLVTSLIGTGILSAGVGLIVGAVQLTPHPISTSEARELADTYNKQLRAELGLTNEPSPDPRKRPGVFQARLAPVVGPRGGGLVLDATF